MEISNNKQLCHRQHYIPRFLQSGFASKKIGENVFSYWFNKFQDPIEVNIKNIGIERGFYGHPEHLDIEITEIEKVISKRILHLRTKQPHKIPIQEAAELIFHFSFRSKCLRIGLDLMVKPFLSKIKSKVLDDHKWVPLSKKWLKENPDILFNEISRYIPINDNIKTILLQNADIMITQDCVSPLFHGLIAALDNAISDSDFTAHAHINTLYKLLLNIKYPNWLNDFCFYLNSYPDNNLILGDVCSIGYNSSSHKYIPAIINTDNTSHIFLPISNCKYIYGVKNGFGNHPPEDLNLGIAQASREFFISSHNTANEKRLINELGNNSEFTNEAEIDSIVNSLFPTL